MKPRLFLLALGLCLFGSGCNMFIHATRNLIHEPVRFADEILVSLHNCALARSAWKDVEEAHPDQAYSKDYACGFRAGFAEYLEAGAPPEPHPLPLPPRKYWTVYYQTPAGHRAMEDWFAGFRHGMTAAQDSGCRQWAIVPLQVPLDPNTSGRHSDPVGNEPTLSPPTEPMLPLPRKVMPPTPDLQEKNVTTGAMKRESYRPQVSLGFDNRLSQPEAWEKIIPLTILTSNARIQQAPGKDRPSTPIGWSEMNRAAPKAELGFDIRISRPNAREKIITIP